MVKTILKKTLKKSKASSFLPKFANADKAIEEISEHFGTVKWSLKRIILPLAVFYILVGVFFQEHILGALFAALMVFLYTNFLPDLDAFFQHGKGGKKANWFEKRIALFFTPLMIYYILSEKARPLDLGENKPFHNRRALVEFTIFLFAFGLIIYFSPIKAAFLALFGFLGFFTHLVVDKQMAL
ncbi:MAG: hypothetical protein Q7R70_04440 [Candidatus Diapherotrites archaeon]|nr:hypothetical protein [Candidatus Diapherotrites archaeon]